MSDSSILATPPLARLLSYLNTDPDNLNLIGDACALAIDARRPDTALELADRYEALAPLPLAMRNVRGLAALQQDRFDDAATIFASLLVERPTDSGLKFNLAWCRSIAGDRAGALELLDDETTATIAGAAALKVQALHGLGQLDEALAAGTRALEKNPQDEALLGALSLVAIDLRLPERAYGWASHARGTPEGLSSLGTLALSQNRVDEAMAYFTEGLKVRPDSARNWLGQGLALLARGEPAEAAQAIDRSAELFGTHLGTWIASGWAHFAAGDRAKARSVFERALELDDTFAESHGALAVLDCLDGDMDSARRRTDTALRLDRKCFAGALAKTLLLEQAGDPRGARKVRDIALNAPVSEGGMTIAQAMIALAPYWKGGGV